MLFGAKSCVEKARKVLLKKCMLVSAIPAACGHPTGLEAKVKGTPTRRRAMVVILVIVLYEETEEIGMSNGSNDDH